MMKPARVIREVTLMQPHKSIPYNENIANAFYYARYIETWGRGIQKICKACAEIGADCKFRLFF